MVLVTHPLGSLEAFKKFTINHFDGLEWPCDGTVIDSNMTFTNKENAYNSMNSWLKNERTVDMLQYFTHCRQISPQGMDFLNIKSYKHPVTSFLHQ